MYGISKSNAQGNVLQGDVIAVETTNSMVRSTSRLVTVVGMKDVIVIDTPDALLVTRVGHCQDVKKVAEYLRVGNRIEAEKHQPQKSNADSGAYTGLSHLFRSDSLTVDSVRLGPGMSMDLPLALNRELVVARGLVTVSTIQSDRVLVEGERLHTESYLPTTLINLSAGEAEVVMIMMTAPISAVPTVPKEVWPMSAYA